MQHADTVHVWLIRSPLPSAVESALDVLLDPAERRRAGTMPADLRSRFVAAHGAARVIVGQHVGAPPEHLRWQRGRHGKPELVGATGVCVNLSHSGALSLVAVTDRRPVGVDVQELRPLDARRMATRFFPAAEARYVAAARGPDGQLSRFTRLWTRKEACVKVARGRLMQGLALPVHHPGRARTVLVRDPTGTLTGPYLARDVPAPEGFHAAVALAGAGPFQVRRRWWPGAADDGRR